MAEAVWFGAAGRVEIRDEPLGSLAPDQVRIRALASGVSAGSELLVYRGHAPRDLPPDLPTIGGDFGFPVKFGYASVGRVVEAGSRVDCPAVGDLVFVPHPHQTGEPAPADVPIPLPADLPPETGVFSANLETALTVVLDAHPRLLSGVLVVGQGVVGLLSPMAARRVGARPTAAVDLHERRKQASPHAGADDGSKV